VDLLEALLLAACFVVIEIPVSSFQIPHFEVTIESLIHVLIRNDPRKENQKFYPLLYSEILFDFPSLCACLCNHHLCIVSIYQDKDNSNVCRYCSFSIGVDLKLDLHRTIIKSGKRSMVKNQSFSQDKLMYRLVLNVSQILYK